MEPLTRESEKLICLMYKQYLKMRSAGYSKADANYFGDTHNLHESFFPSMLFEDFDELVLELKRNGYINGGPGNDILSHIYITSPCIVYMENRFKNGLKDLLTFLANFLP